MLIETGIATTLATTSWDPRSWFALFRYGGDFAGSHPDLRFYEGVQDKDPRLMAVASEEVAAGISCYLLREHFDLEHIADAYACIKRRELVYVANATSEARPDYFCEGADGKAVLAESKGATGTKKSITKRIDPEGWKQVQNVEPVNLLLRNSCSRVVIGTHFCIQGIHPKSETTTIIKDPDGSRGQEKNPESDMVIRLAYAKALQFMGHDILADQLVAGRKMHSPFSELGENTRLPQVGQLSILPLGITPFGDVIGLYGPIGKALLGNACSSLKAEILRALRGFRDKRASLEGKGYALPNGVVIVHDPDELT
ncbi:MAG: hypothetical protein AB7F75_01210 [Planctomycetota bacterium]